MDNQPNKCQKCGRCCRQAIIDDIYQVDLIREPRLKAVVEEFTTEPGRYMLLTPCPFLGKDNLCEIYPTRPDVCRNYELGGHFCPPEIRTETDAVRYEFENSTTGTAKQGSNVVRHAR